MQMRNLVRGVTVIFALAMLTVYVVGSQRRHNQGAFVLRTAGGEGGASGAADVRSREMVAYGSKSGPVFVPETPPATNNAATATNSGKLKKASVGTNSATGRVIPFGDGSGRDIFLYATSPRVLPTNQLVISSSKSAAVFQPGDVVYFATNKSSTNLPPK